jgi:hypothetical protein
VFIYLNIIGITYLHEHKVDDSVHRAKTVEECTDNLGIDVNDEPVNIVLCLIRGWLL